MTKHAILNIGLPQITYIPCNTHICLVDRYYETISEVLSSVRKMEESLKRLKQARKGAAATSTAGANGGPTDDSKIRLQLALDVEYLGEQVNADGRLLSLIQSVFSISHCSLHMLCVSDPEDGSSAERHLHVLQPNGPREGSQRAR